MAIAVSPVMALLHHQVGPLPEAGEAPVFLNSTLGFNQPQGVELFLQADAIPPTEKVEQFGHDTISTFGIGADFTEAQRHSVLRQLLAPGAVGLNKLMLDSGHGFDTLCMSESARAVLKGEMLVPLIESAAAPRERKRRSLAARRRRRRQPALGRAGALHQSQSLARRSGTRAWPARVCDFSRRDAGGDCLAVPAHAGRPAGHQRHGGDEAGGVWGGRAAGVRAELVWRDEWHAPRMPADQTVIAPRWPQRQPLR